MTSYAYAAITTVTVYEKDGVTTNNYPLTFGHVFKKGDAPSNVSVRIAGASVATQCNIKSTYDDGSIRLAILSLLVPTVPANGSVILSLESGGTNYNATPFTKSQLQATGLDAQILLTGLSGSGYSGDLTADLSDSINDTSTMNYWLSGDVVSDMIFEQQLNNSLKALWEVRVYPGTSFIRLSHTIENIEANYRGNVSYATEIKQGTSGTSSVYTKNSTQHNLMSRWRKVLWVGAEPPETELHYNIAYLISTGIVPNYDTNLDVPEDVLAERYASFLSTNHDILSGNGVLLKLMPNVGGREDLGFLPAWTVRYLLSMDNRMKEIMLNAAEMAGHFQIHYREFDPAKTFYKKFINIDDRPTVRTRVGDENSASYDPLGAALGTQSTDLTPDVNHQPSLALIPYVITGDYFYLQELQYWAAWNMSSNHYDSSWGRNYSNGHLSFEIRGTAWGLRTLAHAAVFSLDGSPEKAYFQDKLSKNISWIYATKSLVHPLRNLSHSDGSPAEVTADVTKVTSGWMEDYVLIALNGVKWLGFDVDSIINEHSKFIIGRFSNPDFNKYLGAAYRFPTEVTGGTTVQTWAQAKSLYIDNDKTSWPTLDNPYNYRYIALAALSTVIDQPGGLVAYTWLKNNLNCSTPLTTDPTWAFAPRTSSTKPIIFDIHNVIK